LHCKQFYMGISDRKEREKQEMRKRIIDAAMQMFINDGYEKTSIRNIAEKIEYSPATIYLYYKDKDELLFEVQKEAFDQLNEQFRAHVTSPDPLTRLEQLGREYMRFGEEHPDLYDLMFIIRSPMNVVENDLEKHWSKGEEAFTFLVDCIVTCGDRLRFEDPIVGAVSIWSILHGLLSLRIRCRTSILAKAGRDEKEVANDVVTQFIRLYTR
jgi:AcrR family transcriptional regulator